MHASQVQNTHMYTTCGVTLITFYPTQGLFSSLHTAQGVEAAGNIHDREAREHAHSPTCLHACLLCLGHAALLHIRLCQITSRADLRKLLSTCTLLLLLCVLDVCTCRTAQ